MERLNKFLAHSGIGSRRYCDGLIAAGRVKVNGQPVTDMGMKVDATLHKISVDDTQLKTEKPVYWLVHKPPGYLCTNHDPSGRPRAIDLIPHVEQRVYTVGRLDEGSEGLLLMTNDGDLANKLMHPRFEIEKTYQVLVAGKPSPTDLERLLQGVWLSDGRVKAKRVKRVKAQGESTWIRVVLAEGKNREIRRMLAKLGHKVMRLKRIAIGPIELDRLPKGKSRKLSATELEMLQKTVNSALKRAMKAEAEPEDQPTSPPRPTPAFKKTSTAPRPTPAFKKPAPKVPPPRPRTTRPTS